MLRTVQVERSAAPGSEWDTFVEAQPGAALGHAAAWARVLRNAYNLEPCYLIARHEGAIRGVLPLACLRSLRGRRELVSLPFLDAAGVLATDSSAATALLDGALALARERGARAVELRQREVPAGLRAAASPTPRVDLALALPESAEALWRQLGAKVRNQTRKAEREGLVLGASDPESALAGFYEPYRRNMRDLGSPAHARAFFAEASRALGERLRFFVAEHEGRPVGGLVAIHFARAVTVPWASTLRSERRRCPNNLIYWEALRWAISRGAAELDFGRSPPGSGTWRFKRGWGAQERPLAWLRLDPAGRALPVTAPTDSAPARLVTRVWQRLPQSVCDAVGPRVRRFIAS